MNERHPNQAPQRQYPLAAALAALLLLALAAPALAQYKSFDIAEYRLEQFSTSDAASIALYGARGDYFALLIFEAVAPGGSLPPAAAGSDGIIRLYYERDRWGDILDQLRNEAPVKLHYWMGPGTNSHIATGWEAVGEGE